MRSLLALAVMPLAVVLVAEPLFAAARAQEKTHTPAAATLPPVEVTDLRDPVEKSYRRIVRGMELFEQRRSLAPNASLRFKLLPRHRDTSMEKIALNIVSDNVYRAVPIATDNTFVLERIQRALDEDAVVVPNRKARTMTWRTEIRTPGLPPDTRRLGDLRLECMVGMEAGLISNDPPWLEYLTRLLRSPRYCDQQEPHYLFFTERPLWSVTLVHGSRREVLSVDSLYGGISRSPMTAADLQYCDCEVLVDRTYYAPLGDPRWPDDTLLEFEYMDDGADSRATDSPAVTSGAPRR